MQASAIVEIVQDASKRVPPESAGIIAYGCDLRLEVPRRSLLGDCICGAAASCSTTSNGTQR